jgi:hypothetical protein
MEVTPVDFWAQYGVQFASLQAVLVIAMAAALGSVAVAVKRARERRQHREWYRGTANAGSDD